MYRHRYHQSFPAPSNPVNAAIELWALRYFWGTILAGVVLVGWALWMGAKWAWRNGPGWNPPQDDPAPQPPGNPPAAPLRPINWDEDLFLPARATTAVPAQAPPAAKPASRVNLEIDPFAPLVYRFKAPGRRKRPR